MTSVAQRKASAKYDRNHTRSILFKFNTTSDADILAKLDEVGNKQGYIKELIRENICGKKDVLSVDAIGLMVLPVVQKYGINKVTLFGSYARGDAKAESDIDLLISSLRMASASLNASSLSLVMAPVHLTPRPGPGNGCL